MRTSPAASLLPLALLSASGLAQANSIGKRALEAPLQFDNGWQYQGCYMYVLNARQIALTAQRRELRPLCSG